MLGIEQSVKSADQELTVKKAATIKEEQLDEPKAEAVEQHK